MSLRLGNLRRYRFWLVAAALLGVYAALGFWLVPRLLDRSLRETVASRYGRTLELGRIRFNPFSLELELRDVRLPDADGSALLSFERLYVDLSSRSVLRWGLDFEAIALDAPNARIVRRADGTLNMQDLAGPGPAGAEPDAPPPRIWITHLAVNAGQAQVVDEARPAPLQLALIPISFTLRNFSSRSEGNAYALSVQSALGEQLKWRGTFGLVPLASRGQFELHVRARTLASFAAELAAFEVRDGELALRGHYDVTQRAGGVQARVSLDRLALRDLALRSRGAEEDALVLPSLELTNSLLDTSARSVSLGQLAVHGLQLQAQRARDGQIDLQRWMPTPEPAAEPSAEASSENWSVALPDLQLTAAEFQLVDHGPSRAARLHVGPLDARVLGYASPARGPLELQLHGKLLSTGVIAASGQLGLSPFSAQLDVSAQDVPLRALQPYLDDHTSLIVRDGRAGLQGALKLAADGGVTFTGRAGVSALHTVDAALQEDFIKWHNLQLLGLRVQTDPASVAIDELVATDPYARVIVGPDRSVNLQAVLHARSASPSDVAAAPAAASQPTAAIPASIHKLRIEGGSLNFADLSLRPNFATGVQELRGTIEGLSADPNARADVKLEGRVGRYSPVKITGKVNYFAAAKHTDLHLRFKNMELTAFSPYSGKFAGYKIERGKLDLDLHYLVDRRRLDAKHRIVLSQLQLGAAVDSPDATSLPVKLAVALLKDKNGVIDLDLPVRGNLDDPQFKLGPLVWKVVLNLLSKAVSAPFALLGSLFGGGEEISFVDFAPGEGAVPLSERAKLQTLARALQERPSLQLDVPLVLSPERDRNALLTQRLKQQVEARAARQLGAAAKAPGATARLMSVPKDYRALLERMYRERFGKAPLIPPPLAAAPPPPPKPPAPRHTLLPDGPAHGALARRAHARQARVLAAAVRQPQSLHGLGHVVLARPKEPPKPPQVPDGYAIAWLEAQLKTKISVPERELEALAEARAQQVQSALLEGTGIDPSRVFLIAAPPLANDSALRMQLALH